MGTVKSWFVAPLLATLVVPAAGYAQADSSETPAESRSAARQAVATRRVWRHVERVLPPAIARQNLLADPWGRVVDLELPIPVQLTAPWDRFRFTEDSVQPLTRDGGGCFGDLDGDGVGDMVLASFAGEALFFPGIAGSPRRFGAGTLLRRQTANIADDSYLVTDDADFTSGAIADLDGDGKAELIMGNLLYRNIGSAGAPLLQLDQTFAAYGSWDASASLGDLDGDGDLDIIMVYNYTGGVHLFRNTSTPGHLTFTHQELYHPTGAQDPFLARDNRLAIADLSGDGLPDLAGGAGIYVNTGTRQAPVFNFTARTPWTLVDGPGPWTADNDLGTSLALLDTTGDGLPDAYVTGHDHTFWQVLFYRNTGSAQHPVMRYEGPVTAAATPLCLYYRGRKAPSPSGHRAYATGGDVDGDGFIDILLGTSNGDSFGAPGIAWSGLDRAWAGGAVTPSLSYPDIQTFPFITHVDGNCGVGRFGGNTDALCRPPNIVALWADLTGDAKADALHEDTFMPPGIGFPLALRERQDAFPFSLAPEIPLDGAGSGLQLSGYGAVLLDVDGDGHKDLVTGAENGTLLFHRNLATNGSLALADPVPLTDLSGVPISVGAQSWPAPFDLDGDGDADLLVANYDGVVREVLCQSPGHVNGWALGGVLAAREQNPVDVTHVGGGGHIGPALATLDVDHDGLDDVLMSDVAGRVWFLKNLGHTGAPDFSLRPLVVNRTAAAWLDVLDDHTVRLRFGVPVISGVSTVSYRGLPGLREDLSGRVPVEAGSPAQAPVVPAGCTWYPSTDVPHTLLGLGPSARPSVSSTVHVASGGPITNLDVLGLTGQYEAAMYLNVALTSPAGTTVGLVTYGSFQSGFCTWATEWAIGFDDDATVFPDCPPTNIERVLPSEPLATFNGENPAGDWRLDISDDFSLAGSGSLDSWGLVICQAP